MQPVLTRKDVDDMEYNVYDVYRHVDLMDVRLNDEQRYEYGKILADAFDLMAKGYREVDDCLNGAMRLRLFGPAMFFKMLRPTSNKLKLQRERRKQLLIHHKWATLIKEIYAEQDKIDADKERRQRRKQQPSSQPLLDIVIQQQKDDEIQQRIEDEEKNDNIDKMNLDKSNHDIEEDKNKRMAKIYAHVDDDGYLTFNNESITDEEFKESLLPKPYIPPSHNKLEKYINQKGMLGPLPNQSVASNLEIDKSLLIQRLEDYKYDETDTASDINHRMKGTVKYIKKGFIRKADSNLNRSSLADLTNPMVNKSLKSKYPAEKSYKTSGSVFIPRFTLDREKVKNIIDNLNPAASPGPGGIPNQLLSWLSKRSNIQVWDSFVASVCRYMKAHICYGIPNMVRNVMCYSRGVALKKRDVDVRPICITPSYLRMIDKLAIENIPSNEQRAIMGESQMVNRKSGTETGTKIADHMSDIITKNNDHVILNIDISNAFNSMYRSLQRKDVLRDAPALIRHYDFLYGSANIIDYSKNHRIVQSRGNVQGLTSSVLLYNLTKRVVLENAERRMMLQHGMEFDIRGSVDYVDDGLQVVTLDHAKPFLDIMKEEYSKRGLKMNPKKTKIIINNQSKYAINYIKDELAEYRINIMGNFDFLNISHGNNGYINKSIIGKFQRLETKVRHIELLRRKQYKRVMYQRYCNYNKILYYIKNTRKLDMWYQRASIMFEFIKSSLLHFIPTTPTTDLQANLSSANGGMGLRPINYIYNAARISALLGQDDIVDACLNWKKVSNDQYDQYGSDTMDKYNKSYCTVRNYHLDCINNCKNDINSFLSEDNQLVIKHGTSQKSILQQMDKEWLKRFKRIGNDNDNARILSLGVSGTASWINCVPNNYYGQDLSNSDELVLLSLRMGAKIREEGTICARCGEEMDVYGHHALSCKNGHFNILRHDSVRDRIVYWMKQARMEPKIEQRWMNQEEELRKRNIAKGKQISTILERPGDIAVPGYFKDGRSDTTAYFDVVISNIWSKSYIQHTAKRRLWLAKHKESVKKAKYRGNRNVIPISFEVTGASGPEMNNIIKRMAEIISMRKNMEYSETVNRIRTDIVGVLMRWNSNMIQSSWNTL